MKWVSLSIAAILVAGWATWFAWWTDSQYVLAYIYAVMGYAAIVAGLADGQL